MFLAVTSTTGLVTNPENKSSLQPAIIMPTELFSHNPFRNPTAAERVSGSSPFASVVEDAQGTNDGREFCSQQLRRRTPTELRSYCRGTESSLPLGYEPVANNDDDGVRRDNDTLRWNVEETSLLSSTGGQCFPPFRSTAAAAVVANRHEQPAAKKSRWERVFEATAARERRLQTQAEEAEAAAVALARKSTPAPYDPELHHLSYDPIEAALRGGTRDDHLRDDALVGLLKNGNGDDDQQGHQQLLGAEQRPNLTMRRSDGRMGLSFKSRQQQERSDAQRSNRHHHASRQQPHHQSLDVREEAIAAAMDVFLQEAYRLGYQPMHVVRRLSSAAPGIEDGLVELQQDEQRQRQRKLLEPLRAPRDVVLVFDTSALLSCNRWSDVLELLMALGNTIVFPPTVVHEFDFNVKKWRQQQQQHWEEKEGEWNIGDTTTTRKRSRGHDDSDDDRGRRRRYDYNHHNRRTITTVSKDEIVAKRALVLGDWLAVKQYDEQQRRLRYLDEMHEAPSAAGSATERHEADGSAQRPVRPPQLQMKSFRDIFDRVPTTTTTQTTENNNEVNVPRRASHEADVFASAAAADRIWRDYRSGLAVAASKLDTIATSDSGMVPRNNDDRILFCALYFQRQFTQIIPKLQQQRQQQQEVNRRLKTKAMLVKAQEEDDDIFGGGPIRRRPVLLVTDDRVLALKARSEQLITATALQVLQWE